MLVVGLHPGALTHIKTLENPQHKTLKNPHNKTQKKNPVALQMPHANLEVPTFYGHGSADPLIPPFVAQASLKVLEDLGMKHVNFQLYPGMGHSSCPQELRDLKQFLTKVLPDTAVSK